MPPVGVQHRYLRTGPFVIHLATSEHRVLDTIGLLYDDQIIATPPAFCDFHVSIERPLLRRWLRPKIEFCFDGIATSKPSPPAHGPAVFEWGMNWIIASTANQYLVVHAAVLERNGRALVLPGEPGVGKSTLTAGLAYRGWRLLSDELALIRPATGDLVGLCRPISLKNNSIDVVRQFAPQAIMSAPMDATLKGTIALLKAPTASTERMAEPARPGWIALIEFRLGAECAAKPAPRAAAFMAMARQSLNYGVLGETGFQTLAGTVEASSCIEITYGNLDDAVRFLTEMADAGVDNFGSE